MPTTEPVHGWPIPEDTDPLRDGASAIRALAGAIGADVPQVQYGVAEISLNNEDRGEVDVTFDKAFASPPVVVGSAVNWNAWNISTKAITTTGFTLAARHLNDAAGTTARDVAWIAVGTPA